MFYNKNIYVKEYCIVRFKYEMVVKIGAWYEAQN